MHKGTKIDAFAEKYCIKLYFLSDDTVLFVILEANKFQKTKVHSYQEFIISFYSFFPLLFAIGVIFLCFLKNLQNDAWTKKWNFFVIYDTGCCLQA